MMTSPQAGPETAAKAPGAFKANADKLKSVKVLRR